MIKSCGTAVCLEFHHEVKFQTDTCPRCMITVCRNSCPASRGMTKRLYQEHRFLPAGHISWVADMWLADRLLHHQLHWGQRNSNTDELKGFTRYKTASIAYSTCHDCLYWFLVASSIISSLWGIASFVHALLYGPFVHFLWKFLHHLGTKRWLSAPVTACSSALMTTAIQHG